MRSIHRVGGALAVLAVLGLSPAGAQTVQAGVDGFRAKLEKWVETRQIVSEETADWEVERETLEATRDLLRDEKKSLTEEIAALKATATGADAERDELLARRDEYQAAGAALAERIRGMERDVRAIAPQLPEPLQNKLELLLVQIPEDPGESTQDLGSRLMNVLGVLAQAERWNGTATFVGETRAVDGGDQKVSVRTLYWGLGQAIYVDAQGKTAGVGRPGADGWQFSDEAGMAADAQRLLDIYEGNVDAIEFVPFPVAIH
jgi:hypothetical protein